MNKDQFDWEEFCNSHIWLVLTAFVLVLLLISLAGCGGGGDSSQSQQVNPQVKIGVVPLRCNEAPEAPACPASGVSVSGQAVIH